MRVSVQLAGLVVLVGASCGALASGVRAAAADQPAALQPISSDAFAAVALFYGYDATIPLEARTVERIESDDAVREKIVFRGVRGRLVPAYLEIPKTAPRPAPLVLLLHGWSGGKENWWHDGGYISGGQMRTALIQAGYAVFALDAPTHGDRIAENDYAQVNDFVEDGKATHRNYFTLDEIASQTVLDYRRALDYLATRATIDSARVGMLGYSMGGLQTVILTAVEPRIKVAVACAVPTMVDKARPIAPKDYAQGIGDRPFLMLMGSSDPMCCEAHARQLLDFVASSHKHLIFYDAGHKLPVDYVPDALAWVVKHL